MNRTPTPSLEALEERAVPAALAANWSDGVWRWDSADGWGHLTAQTASQLGIDDGASVVGTFDDGLWRFSDQTLDWQKLSDFQPLSFQVTAAGTVFANFNDIGFWRWDAVVGWSRLSEFTAQNEWAVNDNEVLFGLFFTGGRDIWRWAPDTGWSKIGQNLVLQMEADAAGNLYASIWASMASVSVARWSPTTGWSTLQSNVPSAIEVSAHGEAYLSATPSGIWTAVGTWTTVGGAAPSLIDSRYASEMDARRNGELFAAFGGSEVLLYTPGVGWTVVNNRTAEGMAVGSDGTLFADYGSDGSGGLGGLWRWTDAAGWGRLTDRDSTGLVSQTR